MSPRAARWMSSGPALLVLCALASVAATRRSAAHPPLAFTHVTLIDATGAPKRQDMTVVVVGSRIRDVGPTARIAVPKDARVVDASGKYLIPGLLDMHVHLFSNASRPATNLKEWAFPLFVANGVTGVRDMWTDPDDIALAKQWEREIQVGALVGPRIAWSSRIIDGEPPIWPHSLVVQTADEARRAVRGLARGGAGFIKVYWNLSREAYFAIAEEAKRLRIPFAGHVPFAVSAAEASDAGQKSIEHLTGILETCSTRGDEFRRIPRDQWSPALQSVLWSTYHEQACTALFARFAKNGTWHTPTLVLRRALSYRDSPVVHDNPALKYVPAEEREQWRTGPERQGAGNVEVRRARFAKMLGIVGAMHRAGVGLLAGTDLGNPYIVPGFSLHDELALFVDAGLTPLEALQTATRDAARYLGRSDLGTIEKGKLADLVLLAADPLADIHNTRQVAGVVLNGRYFAMPDLQKMLDDRGAAITDAPAQSAPGRMRP